MVACVAWRFLSNLCGAIGKRESRDNERQSREEPGRETAGFVALCVRVQIS